MKKCGYIRRDKFKQNDIRLCTFNFHHVMVKQITFEIKFTSGRRTRQKYAFISVSLQYILRISIMNI